MVDRFGRVIDYLRISVTDRCDLRCRYCMPLRGVRYIPGNELLPFAEIASTVRVAVGIGVRKVRITGGEPLMRPDLHLLVGKLAAIPGLEDLAMSTNGTHLAQHAQALAAAGLQRVNVSLDALRPERYARVTGGGDVGRVLEGIDAALSAGLTPVKINCVVRTSPREPDAVEVARYARRNALAVRFIRRMDLAAGKFSVVDGGSGGDCLRCNRLRLTSDGNILPCLFADLRFSIRDLGPARALEQAIRHKPRAGTRCTEILMHAIGG